MSGAVTALGDTLFPVDPTVGDGLFQRVRDDLSAANHFLVRLRIVHPIVAAGTAGYLLVLGNWVRLSDRSPRASRWANALIITTLGNVALGVVNIWLHAPGYVQLLHLFFAQVVWICAFLMGAAGLSEDSA
jgi:heme A synthase